MIIDTSALVAIATREPERDTFLEALAAAPVRRVSAGTWIELNAVCVRSRVFPITWLDEAPRQLGFGVEPVTLEQARIGQEAYRRYGLGSGSPAKLNFGDSFAYALAKAYNEPLLFKGNDFSQTDVVAAA